MMTNNEVCIASIASAFPESVEQSTLWSSFFAEYFRHSRLAHAAFSASGIHTRHAVVNPIDEDLSQAPTSLRMERFITEALPLGKEAITQALSGAAIDPDVVGMFVAVTCTGYATPGIDTLLARDLGMSQELERILVGHVGCHAGIPALRIAHDFVATQHRPAIVVSLELPSLHLQPVGSAGQIVPHALFSDAASAVVVQPATMDLNGLRIIDFATRSILSSADDLTWQITDTGFRMELARRLPDVIGAEVAPLIAGLLDRHELGIGDIDHWAVHPGGPRVLDTVAAALGLDDAALGLSRSVLADHGNCSSATIFVILETLMGSRSLRGGERVVALAFGPGLTCVAVLLEYR